MKKIQMVDLSSQYHQIKSEIDNAIQDVIDSCAFINGPAVKNFQEAGKISVCKACDSLCKRD